ncbi:MAG: phosphopyruvate hydratase [Clostridiales bacterium]|nr:phosphopyruvate hydratase [Clostridiales bacterium]
MKITIDSVRGREVIDSRGNPTVEAEVGLSDGTFATASVPSGASTGAFEAVELRDNDKNRYGGKGVNKAVENVNRVIAPALCGDSPFDQCSIDYKMTELDGTDNKSNLGANAILAVSLACAKAAAGSLRLPLFRYIGGAFSVLMPVPMMNILNGGAHASNNIDIQEFMIMPTGAGSFSEGLRQCCEIYHTLGNLLKKNNMAASVGDEGGYAPNLESDEEAVELIIKAIDLAGYSTENTKLALDAAASEWYENGVYKLPKRGTELSSGGLIDYFEKLTSKYPVISIEDPLSEYDWDGWSQITGRLGGKIQLVGDDLFVTNTSRLSKGIEIGAANSILIKINQIGTLTETLDAISTAQRAGYTAVISHRSGETEDTVIADIAVGVNAGQIKTGAPCRTDRVCKYNRLLRIEESIKNTSRYGFY